MVGVTAVVPRGERRHAGPPHIRGPSASDDLSTYAHRQWVGCLGAMLPVVTWLLTGLRPDPVTSHGWHTLDSISVYYYTSGEVAFAGALSALAIYLLTYHGFDNAFGRMDRILSRTAGVAAALVALFPTEPVYGPRPGWWRPWIGAVHYGAAAVLFVAFMVFSLFLFTRTDSTKPSAGKVARNAGYRICGLGIAACLAWILLRHGEHEIFWPETLALWFFATSWLVKGRVDYTATLLLQKAGRPTEPRRPGSRQTE